MHPGHVYNHSGYVFACDQSTADHSQTEWTCLSWVSTTAPAPCHTLTHAHTRYFAISSSLALHLPPWRDPFSEWKTCLDVSEIYISAHTQGARLLRLKEEKGVKKEMNFKVYRHVLSQYPALWPCLIYEAASFIFSPVVYQPHETSTRTSFLTTYTEMCALALS